MRLSRRFALERPSGCGRPSVLDCDDHDAVVFLEKDVHEDHPPPRTEDKAEAGPAPAERRAEEWKALERFERSPETRLRVGRKTVRRNQTPKNGRSGLAQLDASHLKVVERDGAALAPLGKSLLRTVEGPVDAVEELREMARVRVRLVERAREERAGERALLDSSTFGEDAEFLRVLVVKRDV